MENDFTILLNDRAIKCNTKFVQSNFPEFYQSSNSDKNQRSIQIDEGNDFYEVTKDIFQGNDYSITNDNFGYLSELTKKIQSNSLQTKLNSFLYNRECDDHQIDQHPSIQFLVELSTLIHQLSLSNYEDISSQIKQKLAPTINETKKSNSESQTSDQEKENDNSEQEEDAETEEEKIEEKALSLEMIGSKEFNKLLYFEILNTISTGFDSFENLQEHVNKVELIIQLIKELDSINHGAYLNTFINYVIEKYKKVQNQKSTFMNYKQEIQYLLHFLLSNKLITLSQIHDENSPIELYFLEFFEKSQIKKFFSSNEQITDFIKEQIGETKGKNKNKSKSKKSLSSNEDEYDESLLVDFLSKNIKNGIIQDNELINVFINDDLKKFKGLFNNDESIDSYQLPTEIAEISCLSALNHCSLLELSAFLGSQKIFEYLNDKELKKEIKESSSLPFYVIIGQHPQIIKLFLKRIDTKDSDSILQILSFCNDHHYNDTFEMIINTFENCPKLTIKQLDEYMQKCISRGYFDNIPKLLKEGSTVDVLLNLFSKSNNEIGVEYMLEYSYINVNKPYKNKTPLEYCLDNKNERDSILLLKNDYINIQEIDNKSINGQTILHTACSFGLPKVVSYLLRKHLYDVNLPTQEGVFPIHFACESGNYETVATVVRAKKVHIRTKVKSGEFMKRTALHFACCSGNPNIITLLLDSDSKLGLDDVDCKERTPIIYAIKGNFVGCLRVLLEQEEIDINQEYKGNNLLQYACLKNQNDVFDVILDSIVFDPNQPCADGRVILVVAIERNNIHMVKSILDKFERSVDVNIDSNGKTPLIIACEMGEIEIVKLLLSNISIDSEKPASVDGTTPFMAAARSGKVELLKLLIDTEEVDVHQKNKLGMSAIHFAFYAGQIDAVEFLLPYFIDNLNDKTDKGETLLQIACKRGDIQLSKLLINNKGVDVNVRDNEGMTPFLSGVQEGKFELIKALIDSNDCDLNEKANDGRNAFLIAVESQNIDLIKFFIDLYAKNNNKSSKSKKNKSKNTSTNFVDINAKSNDGRNALSIALKLKNKDILQELINCPLIDINETSRDYTFVSKVVKKLCKPNLTDSFNYIKILDMVLERKDLDINKPSPRYDDKTCLHLSCASQAHNMILFKKLLAIDGIDINAESKEGTPLFLLIKYQNEYFNHNSSNDLVLEMNNNNNNHDSDDDDESDEGGSKSNSSNVNNMINDDNKEQNCWCDFLDNPNLDINKGGDPAFTYGLKENQPSMPDHMIFRHGFNRNKISNQNQTTGKQSKKPEYQSPLEFAILNQYENISEALISKKDIDINSNNNLKKMTPLHLAINNKNMKLIELILSKKKVKFDIQDADGFTPLLLAINMNSPDLTEFILNLLNRKEILKGINICDKSNERTPFLASTLNSSTEIFSKFLTLNEVDFDYRDKKGRTALYLLVKSVFKANIDDVNERIVMLLDKRPSLLNIPTKSGKTPLFCSMQKIYDPIKTSEIILYLLDQENIDLSLPDVLAEPEQKSETNKSKKKKEKFVSLLHVACSKCIPTVVERLIPLMLKSNENIFAQKNESGNTILNIACSSRDNRNVDSISVILNYVKNNINYNDPDEFDINLESSNNLAPLHAICSMNETKETLEALNNLLSFETLDINAKSSKELKTALHYACINNNKKVVETLINSRSDSIDPNIYDNEGNTPLLIAVSKNESPIVKRLLRADFNIQIDVNSPRPLTKETPLYTACDLWNVKIVKRLLDDPRTDPNCHLRLSGKTPLMYCIENNKVDLFILILSNNNIDLDAVDNDKLTILHYACRIGSIEFVKEIISRKIDTDENINDYLNKQTNKGLTPLHYACLSNSRDVILYLLNLNEEKGIHIDINICDNNKFKPFDIYLNNKSGFVDENVYKAFLKENNNQAIQTSANIQEICENSHFGVIKFIISDNISFDINNNDNQMQWTLLHVLCKKQKIDLLQNLLKKPGLNINAIDINKMTPLHHAIKVGFDATIVKMLLNTKKCDLNIKDIKGRTVLHYACEMGKTQIVNELMKYANDIDINAQDNNGSTVFHDIANSPRFDISILKLLFNSNCDPNIANNEGNTPLHVACSRENNSFVSSFIELSPVEINVNAINKKYQTPLFITCMKNDTRTFNTLFASKIHHMIDINVTSPIYIAAIKESILVERLLDMPDIDLNCNKKENQLNVDPDEIEYDFSGLNLLHIFSCYDSIHLLKKLIQSNQYDINESTAEYIEDKMNGTPLIIALKNQRLKNLFLLLDSYDNELDLSIYDKNGLAAVHYCFKLESNGVNILSKLIKIDESVINMETKDKLKLAPLMIAFQQNNLDCINLLLQQSSIDVFSIDNELKTPVHYACAATTRSDILDLVLMKIKSSTKDWSEIIEYINTENINGETALMVACKNANLYAVQSLMETFKDSLDFSIPNNDGLTPFLAAIQSNENDLIHLLLLSDNCMSTIDISKPVNNNNDYIPMLMAKNSNIENFKLLLDQALSHSSDINFDFINVKNNKGESLITIAAGLDSADLFNYICETQNPDLNILIDDKIPLVFKAAQSYDFEVFKSIIEHGNFDLNQMFEGKTVLHYAVESYQDAGDKVKFIIQDENVDVNCATKRGSMTPLHLAIKKKKVDLIEVLLSLKGRIDVNKMDSKGRSAVAMGKSSIRNVRSLFDEY